MKIGNSGCHRVTARFDVHCTMYMSLPIDMYNVHHSNIQPTQRIVNSLLAKFDVYC